MNSYKHKITVTFEDGEVKDLLVKFGNDGRHNGHYMEMQTPEGATLKTIGLENNRYYDPYDKDKFLRKWAENNWNGKSGKRKAKSVSVITVLRQEAE